MDQFFAVLYFYFRHYRTIHGLYSSKAEAGHYTVRAIMSTQPYPNRASIRLHLWCLNDRPEHAHFANVKKKRVKGVASLAVANPSHYI